MFILFPFITRGIDPCIMEQNLIDAMEKRHSVRKYNSVPIPSDVVKTLREEIERCNVRGCLDMQLITDHPDAFDGIVSKVMKFSGVRNFIIVTGHDDEGLHRRAGYYGEKIVLLAQSLGLNTCWSIPSPNPKTGGYDLKAGYKTVCMIAIGYGIDQGVPHKSKPMHELCEVEEPMPEWFRKGMEAAMLAPTSMHRQKFKVILEDDGDVVVNPTGGRITRIDAGIVERHFELGAGKRLFHV